MPKSHVSSGIYLACVISLLTATAAAQEQELVELQEIAAGLSDPSSLTVRPGGSRSGPDLLLAEREVGRVLGIVTTAEKPEPIVVLEGFDLENGPSPTGLVFRSRNRLLAAIPGSTDSAPLISEYDLDDELLPMSSEDRKVVLKYETSQSVRFPSIDFDHGGVIAVSGDHQWLLRGRILDSAPQKLKQFIDAKESSGVGNPTAIVFSEKGYIVVAQAGPSDELETTRLVFYHPTNQIASPLMVLDTGLPQITDLAYSSTTGNLFATCQFKDAPERSGLYRLQARFDSATGGQQCEAVLIAKVPNPSSLAFVNDGSLFLSTGGDGKLLKGPTGL